MEASDPDQRDVIPEGSRLKRWLTKPHRFGVDVIGMEPMGDLEREGPLWKHADHEVATAVPTDSWQGYSVGYCQPGYGEGNRVGRTIRVVGIELAIQMSLVCWFKGTMLPNGSGGFLTEVNANGPLSIRLLLVVRPKAQGTTNPDLFPLWGQLFRYNYAHSPLSAKAIDDGVGVLFDKSYTMDSDGDFVLDRAYIDCWFEQKFNDEYWYPWMNDLELWVYPDSPEYGGWGFSAYVRTWYLDD